MKGKRIALLMLVVAFLLFSCSYASPSLTEAEKIMGLSTVWRRAYDVYAYWELLEDLDWDAAYAEHVPKVLAAATTEEYYGVLTEFLALLRDGHSFIMPPKNTAKTYYNPLNVVYLDGRYVIHQAASAYSGLLGAEVLTMESIPPAEYLEAVYGKRLGTHTPGVRESYLGYQSLQADTQQELTYSLRLPSGEVVEQAVTFQQSEPKFKSMSLELPHIKVYQYSSFTACSLEGGIYFIELSNFSNKKLSADLGSFFEEVDEEATAYIYDARNNAGGSSTNAIEALSYFCPAEDLSGYQSRVQYKDAIQMAFASCFSSEALSAQMDGSIPDKYMDNAEFKEYMENGMLMLESRYYVDEQGGETPGFPSDIRAYNKEALIDKPVVILSGTGCGSAGDDFIAMAKGAGPFTVIGTHTMGGTGQLAAFDLPQGGLLALSSRRNLVDGKDIVNAGVEPDIYIEQSYEDYLQGIDTVLTFAIDFLQKN